MSGGLSGMGMSSFYLDINIPDPGGILSFYLKCPNRACTNTKVFIFSFIVTVWFLCTESKANQSWFLGYMQASMPACSLYADWGVPGQGPDQLTWQLDFVPYSTAQLDVKQRCDLTWAASVWGFSWRPPSLLSSWSFPGALDRHPQWDLAGQTVLAPLIKVDLIWTVRSSSLLSDGDQSWVTYEQIQNLLLLRCERGLSLCWYQQ